MDEPKLPDGITNINDVVYIEPDGFWWKVKLLFADIFHPDAYLKKEQGGKNEKAQLREAAEKSEPIQRARGQRKSKGAQEDSAN